MMVPEMALAVKPDVTRHQWLTAPRSAAGLRYGGRSLRVMASPSRQDTLAAAIRAAMDAVEMRPETLAEIVGTSKRTVQRWRSGEGAPDVLQLRPMADALGVEPSLFIDPPELPQYPLDAYRLPPEEVVLAAARLAQRDQGTEEETDPPADVQPRARPRKHAVSARR